MTDDELLDATVRTINRLGPALTLRDVGSEAGLSAPALVQRFGSKRKLLLALIRRDISTIPQRFAGERSQHQGALDSLVAAMVNMAKGIHTPTDLANSLAFVHLDLTDPAFRVLARRHAAATLQQIEALIREAISSGDLVSGHARQLAYRLQVTYNGTLLTWGLHSQGGTLAKELRSQLKATLAGWSAMSDSSLLAQRIAGGG
jgi:AcrR family transcriptional regulator